MNRFEGLLTTIISIAAVVVTAALVKREFIASPSGGSIDPQDHSIAKTTWDSLWNLGQPTGDESGAHKMVILTDFECPACRQFHIRVSRFADEHPGELQIRLVHLPLSYHRFAGPAARVFECASPDPQLARRLADEFYGAQDSIGLLPWSTYLARAGGADTARAAECASAPVEDARFERIARGLQFGTDLAVKGTPTVVID